MTKQQLKIVFGLNLDSLTHHEPDFRTVVYGQNNLIRFLEERLGILRESESQEKRILAFCKVIDKLIGDKSKNTPYFFEDSYETDYWATANMLLSWRDSLIMGGMTKDTIFGKDFERLKFFHEAENCFVQGFDFKNGFCDRIVDLINQKTEVLEKYLPEIELKVREPENSLPSLWKTLFCKIAKKVSYVTNTISLSHEQMTVLKADNPNIASQYVAEWLKLKESKNEDVVLLAQDNLVELNREFENRNMAKLDVSESSSQRSSLQILPALIDMFDGPFSTSKMYAFLNLPNLPVDHVYNLKNALDGKSGRTKETCEPSEDGDGWYNILERLAHKSAKDLEFENENPDKNKVWLSPLSNEDQKSLLNIEGKALKDGSIDQNVALEDVKGILQILEKWLGKCQQDDGIKEEKNSKVSVPYKTMILEQIEAYRYVLENLGKDKINVKDLKKILSTILGNGVCPTKAQEQEASKYVVLTAPEQLLMETNVLLWWAFKDPVLPRCVYPWRKREREELERLKLNVDTPSMVAERATNEWKSATQFAKKIIFIQFNTDNGVPTVQHPFADELGFETNVEKKERLEFSKALVEIDGENLEIENLKQCESVPVETSDKNAEGENSLVLNDAKGINVSKSINLEKGPYEKTDDTYERTESATSLRELYDCPLKWYWGRYIGIKESYYGIRSDYLSEGDLAHSVLEHLVKECSVATKKKNGEYIGKYNEVELKDVFEKIVKVEADYLNGNENKHLKEKIFQRIKRNVESFVSFIQSNNLEVLEVQGQKAAELEVKDFSLSVDEGVDIPLYSKIDLVLKTEDKKYIIIDYKNSSNDKYAEDIENHKSVQLYVYQKALEHLIEDENNGLKGYTLGAIGFFMLKTNKLVFDRDVNGITNTDIENLEIETIFEDEPNEDSNDSNLKKEDAENDNSQDDGEVKVDSIVEKLKERLDNLKTGTITKDNLALESGACEHCPFEDFCCFG